ncbi:MAG: 4'-phosphopantetheinyl transferase superfamily protein [Actinomycetota bacterium]|nr:4'-phosphopantetheinyl transferase superfamily protein [Actinomycetota bacterium]
MRLPPPLAEVLSILPAGAGAEALELRALRPKSIPTELLDLSLLDRTERRRADSLRREEDRLSYVAAHVLLRRLLSERLGIAPQHIPLLRQPCPVCGNSTGRPAVDLPGPPLHFSVSRSAGLVLIGTAPTAVGVDVESLPEPGTVSTVAALLHPRERQELAVAAPAERPALFARLWTRKEALLKARGVGIAHGLDADYIGTQPQAVSPAGWTIFDLDLPGGFTAAATVAA